MVASVPAHPVQTRSSAPCSNIHCLLLPTRFYSYLELQVNFSRSLLKTEDGSSGSNGNTRAPNLICCQFFHDCWYYSRSKYLNMSHFRRICCFYLYSVAKHTFMISESSRECSKRAGQYFEPLKTLFKKEHLGSAFGHLSYVISSN